MGTMEKVTNAALAVGVLVAAGVLVWDRVQPRQAPGVEPERVERIDDWAAMKDTIAVSVDAPAKTQQLQTMTASTPTGRRPLTEFAIDITVFTDFTCPACKMADTVVAALADEFIVTRHIVHFPLGREYSIAAAQAFECAYEEGQGAEMHRALYDNQRQFGLKSWAAIAREAGIEDTLAFNACLTGPQSPRIKAGLALAERIKTQVTPTAVIDGWVILPSSPARLRAAFQKIVRREHPD